jgi:TetR/AcrR family transcriptional repressor of nem operon
MDELTKVTGLSRSSIYNSFGDKHGLFLQCLNYYKNSLLDTVMQSLEKWNSPLKKIEMVFKLSIDGLLKDKDRKGCLIVNTTTELANIEEEILLFMKEHSEQMEKLFQDWVKEGQQSGEISKSFPARALARHLFNSYSGIKIIAQTTNDRKTLDDIVNVALSVLKK